MKRDLNPVIRVVGLSIGLAAFAAVIGFFSDSPTYVAFPPDSALIKLSVAADGVRTSACRQRDEAELAKLSVNMRTKMVCQRERAPVVVELVLDGKPVLTRSAEPAGLSRDGASTFYGRFPVPAGSHTLAVRMRNTPRTEGFDFAQEETVILQPAQVLAVSFDRQRKAFIIR